VTRLMLRANAFKTIAVVVVIVVVVVVFLTIPPGRNRESLWRRDCWRSSAE